MATGSEAQFLGSLGRRRQMSSTVKRCRDCQAPVRWAETRGGWRVKLDAHPVSGGAWALDAHGIAYQVNRKHANHGVYQRHICEDAA
jgi:hypothetical protein